MVGLGATVVLAAVGIPAWINLSIPEERRYYLANTVVGQHMDGPHGLGPTGKLYHAFWLVFQRVVHNGLFAARRVPHPPT
ncbi:hypothetical protein FRC02_008569 [Tulasnella sp. 418]|nr:hypothetical protein FRC02_008569 [Tulasnella sp. 418]